MLSALSEWLYNTSDLAPHGYCLLWEPRLIWLYAISDGLIALAYFSIPLSLVIIGRRRSDLVYVPMLWLFAAFILFCGATHWLDLLTLWKPLYGLQGFVKAATAVASVATAIMLWRALPHFLALPSVDELQRANAALLASEERLAHAQKLEAIGQLTGGIAHDFNNVLQVITGSLSIVDRMIARGRANEIGPPLSAIRKASSTASDLVNRMLAFSRRQTLLPRVIEPDKLIAGMEEMLRRTLGPQIELELRLGRCQWNVNCDPSQLESAMLNLAINARDAMPEGGVLRFSTADRTFVDNLPEPDMKPGNYVEINVTDNGQGMNDEVRARVFEPFFTTKPTGRGTGLGLSQIYGFVKQSGGSIDIESAPGKGTTVRIYLPGHASGHGPARESTPKEARHVVCSEAAPSLGGVKVLLIEDQDEIRLQIADMLKDIGCAVIEASDGATGMGLVESCEAFDLLITDIGLPGIDGRRIAEAANTSKPDLAVLLITGYAGKPTEAFQLGPNMELMHKPFTMEQLVARVQTMSRHVTAAH